MPLYNSIFSHALNKNGLTLSAKCRITLITKVLIFDLHKAPVQFT